MARRKREEECERRQREWMQRQQDMANVQAEAKRMEEERKLEEEHRKRAEAEANAAREKAEADEAEKKRLIEQQKVEKAERCRERRIWWKQNLKWFLLVIAAILIYAVVSSMYQSSQDKRQQERAIAEQQRQDSIAFAEQQSEFNELYAEFENLMRVDIYVDNAYEKVMACYSVLQRMRAMLNDNPTLSDISLKNSIDRYNDRVDDAYRVYKDAIDDPNSYPMRDMLKERYTPILQRLQILKIQY